MNMTERAAEKHSNTEQGRDGERGCGVKTLHASICFWEGGREGREKEREYQGQQTSNALLSPKSMTWLSRDRPNTQGRDPEKGRRGGTDQTCDRESRGAQETSRHRGGNRERPQEETGCILHPLCAPPPPPTKSSPGLGLNERPGPKDGDQRMQSVGATGEQGEPQAHGRRPPSLQPRSCREKAQHQCRTFHGVPHSARPPLFSAEEGT